MPEIKKNNLIRFCNGDNEAIVKTYKKWVPELYFIAYKYLRNKEDAEDIVSDSFEKLLQMPLAKRKKKFIEEEINLKALLILVVKNKALDKVKVKNNRLRIMESIRHIMPTVTSNLVWNNISNDLIESLVNFLPEKDQKILKMNMEGYNREEIGKAFNLSLKSVSNSLSYSRKKLKTILDDFN